MLLQQKRGQMERPSRLSPMYKRSRPKLPRNHIQPTKTQIASNVIVVPRYFINENRNILRWFHTFDVEVEGQVCNSRHLDSENRVGGVAMRGRIDPGTVFHLTISANTLRLTSVPSLKSPSEPSQIANAVK